MDYREKTRDSYNLISDQSGLKNTQDKNANTFSRKEGRKKG